MYTKNPTTLSFKLLATFFNRDHLAKIKQVRLALTLVNFKALSELLGFSQTLVLFTVGARRSGQKSEEYLVLSDPQLKKQVAAGTLSNEVNEDALHGVRGKRPADTGMAILKLQANGSNRLANSPSSTRASSDKNRWKTKPCPQVYPLNKPVSEVARTEIGIGSQSMKASLYTSAPHNSLSYRNISMTVLQTIYWQPTPP